MISTAVGENAPFWKGGPRSARGDLSHRLCQSHASWFSHQKETYLAAQYKRLVKRMGKKKALVAVGHSMLVMAYPVLQTRTRYQDLGGDYFD